MAVTIKEVAALAGVSPSTVSRTCKDNPSISQETKKRVRQAMAQLGYEPNFQASNLASQNSHTVGIILPPSAKEAYENSFYLQAIRGISQFCNRRQYINTVITGENDEELLQVIRTMTRGGQVDGFICLYSRQEDPVIDFLHNEGFLYVLIGKACHALSQTIYIDNDNFMAGQEATDYLLHLGHRKIGYIGTNSRLFFSEDRKAGYQTALLRAGLPFRTEYIVELPSADFSNLDTLRNLLASEKRPTAFVVSDDIFAATLAQLCMELRLSVPDDLSIISFNNSIFSRLSTPPLTSIEINSFQLGAEAASQIINHIENPNLMATKIIVPYHLVERESCKELL